MAAFMLPSDPTVRLCRVVDSQANALPTRPYGGPVENPGDQLDLLPSEEGLVRLLELVERYGARPDVTDAARTVSEQHRVTHGHRLTWGCCAQERKLAS
jgi:hypothetical protein